MNTCSGAFYNLENGSWLAWANDTAAHYVAINSVPELANDWTCGAACRHTTAPITYTKPSPIACKLLLISYPAKGRRLSWPEHTVG